MITEIFKVDENSIKELTKASKLLINGELVAIPTETVYGLGANALDKTNPMNFQSIKILQIVTRWHILYFIAIRNI